MIEVGLLVIGMIVGAALVRYGYGLGFKAHLQAREDAPLIDKARPYETEYTE